MFPAGAPSLARRGASFHQSEVAPVNSSEGGAAARAHRYPPRVPEGLATRAGAARRLGAGLALRPAMTNTFQDTRATATDTLHDAASTVASTSKDWLSRAERLVQLAIRMAPLMPSRAWVSGLERVGLRQRSASRFDAAAAFTAGLFVGGVVTALVTPWSGATLRAKIASGFVRAEASAAAEVERAASAVKDAEAQAVEGAHSVIADAKSAIADGRESLADAIRDPKRSDGYTPVGPPRV